MSTDADFSELTTDRRAAALPQPDGSADRFADPFADLLTLERDAAATSAGTAANAAAPVARHGHFGDGLFGEAKPTAPQTLLTRLLSGTIGSLVAVGAGLGLVLGTGLSLVGGDDAPVRSAAGAPGAAQDAAAPAGQQAAGAQNGQGAQQNRQAGGQQAQGGQQAGSQAKPSVPVDAQGRPTLTGSFTLWAASPQKDACADHPQVPDITRGAAVVLTDGAGKELAKTTLGAGTVEATKRGCVFGFQLAGLPKSDSYQLKVGRQGALTFAGKDLAANGWRVQLNLGLPSQTG